MLFGNNIVSGVVCMGVIQGVFEEHSVRSNNLTADLKKNLEYNVKHQ